ncbi:MAG: tRNA uridine-5-carboxymethylaminomethyl(34) synthesis GTPase MnmE, partial [Gemmatimonadaceae bacterium]
GELAGAIAATLSSIAGTRAPIDTPLLTRERHRWAITTALEEIRAFDIAWRDGALPALVTAVHLRAAAEALEEMIGTVDVDHVLDRVFASFCVGK